MAKIYVDDIPVGEKELFAELGVDPKSIPNKLERIFEINPDRVRRDPDNFNMERTPRRMGVPTKFNAYSKAKGRMVTVRFAEQAIPSNRNGFVVTNYSPGQLWINGKEEYVKDDTAYIYMYLHPDCFNSPFRKVDSGWRYMFKDNEANASARLLKEEQKYKAMGLIIGEYALSERELRQIAKGMNIVGVDNLTFAEVKDQLKEKANANPERFYEDAHSTTIQFNGTLRDAVDKGVLVIHTNNGFRRWYFNNEELCAIPSGVDEMHVLKEAVVKRSAELIPQIINELEGRTIESELDKPDIKALFQRVRANSEMTRQDVSPNLKKENKDLDEQAAFEADIKALAEEEEAEQNGGDKMHYKRKEKLVRYRAEVDAYKASLQQV